MTKTGEEDAMLVSCLIIIINHSKLTAGRWSLVVYVIFWKKRGKSALNKV
jgi:hypothetical protein